MATEGISDVLVGDRLSDLNLKPWWEKYRGYSFAVSVVIAGSITYILRPGETINCLPDTDRNEDVEDFSVPVATFVKSFCVSNLPVPFTYAGAIALGCCAALLALSTYWLHIPKLVDAFETYSSTQKILEELQLTTEQLMNLSVSSVTEENKEDVLKVRKACAHLWNYEVKLNLRHCYGTRNILLCVASVGIIIGESFMLHSIIIKADGIFTCVVQGISAISINTYTCTGETALLLSILTFAYIICVGFHLFFVVCGMMGTWHNPPQQRYRLTKRWLEVGDLLKFINTFWRNSRPINSKCFDKFFEFLASEAPDQLFHRFKEELDWSDAYLIELFTKLVCDWTFLLEHIRKYLDSSDERIDFASERYTQLLAVIDKTTTLEWCKGAKDLIKYLYDKKYFELLVSVLNKPLNKQKWEHEDLLCRYINKILKLNLDVIGQPYEKGRSLLYYALKHRKTDGAIRERAAIRIFRFRKSKAYVHCDGKSYTAKTFAEENRLPGFDPENMKLGHHCKLREYILLDEKLEDISEPGLEIISEIRHMFQTNCGN